MKRIFLLQLYFLLAFSTYAAIAAPHDVTFMASNTALSEQMKLADMYFFTEKYPEALILYRNAAAQGVVSAKSKIGWMYHFGKGIPRNYSEAMKWYQDAAVSGDATAQNYIGELFRDGLGVSRNYPEAVKWFLKSVLKNEQHAQINLAEMYENGFGVAQDYASAFGLYLKAARQDNTIANYKAGYFLQNGLGVNKDIKNSIGWYKTAANAGNVDALLALGEICFEGLFGDQNYDAARRWYERAADQGNAHAQYMLGLLYQNGLGIEQDNSVAIKWYKLSAQNGNKDALANLDNINKNKLNSPETYLLAAKAGDTSAMHNLGVMYDNGLGTSVDHVKAINWFIKEANKKSDSNEVYNLELRESLYKENFQALEDIAITLRKTKIKSSGGFWKLESFYDVISHPIDRNSDNDEHWQYIHERIDKWAKAYPESVTARIILGQFCLEYAWKARGTGYASTVSEKSWRIFHSRLEQAEMRLNEARLFSEKCPQWYSVMLKIAFSDGWEPKRFNELFAESIKSEPSYMAYYKAKSDYLSPKWYGNEGDTLGFANEVEQFIGGKQGLALFSQIIWFSCASSGDAFKFMQENIAAWDKIKKGYIYREELYGENLYDLNRFCYMAVFAGDKQTSKVLFNRIGNNWDKEVFVNKNLFDFHKANSFK